MSTYLDLPNELIALVVTDWLSWKAVGQLDSAICSKDNRNRWLDLLKKECIFKCVNVGYVKNLDLSDIYRWCPNLDLSNHYRWCMFRQIRTSELLILMESIEDLKQQDAVFCWLQDTASLVTTLHVISSSGRNPVNANLEVCRNLRKFSLYNCAIDDTFWMLIRNNLYLEELRVLESVTNYVVHVPTNLSLFKIKKLELGFTLFSTSDAVLLFRQLPALECLQVVEDCPKLVSYIYDVLPDSCPKLMHLDLKLSNHSADDKDCFYRLMKSLACGLRSLVLPEMMSLTIREMQSIAQYQSHSLKCFEISSRFYPNEDTDSYNLADLINSLPHLHTFSIIGHYFAFLRYKKITNPAITHLMIDFCGVNNLSHLTGHCPATTTLSVFNFPCYTIVRDVKILLQSRPFILYVWTERRLCCNYEKHSLL